MLGVPAVLSLLCPLPCALRLLVLAPVVAYVLLLRLLSVVVAVLVVVVVGVVGVVGVVVVVVVALATAVWEEVLVHREAAGVGEGGGAVVVGRAGRGTSPSFCYDAMAVMMAVAMATAGYGMWGKRQRYGVMVMWVK